MFDEDNSQCRECLCTECDLRGTDNCLEGADQCNRCDNTSHLVGCVYYDDDDDF